MSICLYKLVKNKGLKTYLTNTIRKIKNPQLPQLDYIKYLYKNE